MDDLITKKALEVIETSNDVLETKEILESLQLSLNKLTRTKLFSRLNNLRGEGLIKGKFVGPGKGVWIWWKKDAFFNNITDDKNGGKNEK
jgi:hypothetical protein